MGYLVDFAGAERERLESSLGVVVIITTFSLFLSKLVPCDICFCSCLRTQLCSCLSLGELIESNKLTSLIYDFVGSKVCESPLLLQFFGYLL